MGEGSTDRVLLPIIRWLLSQHLSAIDVVAIWADRAEIPVPRPRTLAERIVASLRAFPCNILFVHRDGDRAGRAARIHEIERATVEASAASLLARPVVPVVPVRETEAWLLFDQAALCAGARNPNGNVRLALPRPSRVESISDPKRLLNDLIRTASELRGRHLERLTIDPIRGSPSHLVNQGVRALAERPEWGREPRLGRQRGLFGVLPASLRAAMPFEWGGRGGSHQK
jgi:hypothetical protein